MITRIRIDGEAPSSDRMQAEFDWLANRIKEAFSAEGVEVLPGHSLLERFKGDPDVSVFGNWKGRTTIHLSTQKLNDQLNV